MRAHRRLVLAAIALSSATPGWAGVRGRILSFDGQPLEGARVVAYVQETSSQLRERILAGGERHPIASGRAAADGTFHLDTTDAVVDLEVRADGFAPGFAEVSAAERTSIALQHATTMTGIVTRQGRPVTGAIVAWFRGNGFGSASGITARTGADGRYEMPDPEVWATAFSVRHPDSPLLVGTLEPNASAEPLRLELDSGVTITGRVVERGSDRPVEGAMLSVNGWPLGRSAQDGSFILRHALPIGSRIQARAEGLAGSTLATRDPLQVRVAPARSLRGIVLDANTRARIAGATVWIYNERTMDVSWTTTDARGRYAFADLAAARYHALVTHPGYAITSGFVSRAGFDGIESDLIDLVNSASAERDFKAAPRRMIRGLVLDERGAPVDRAFVRVGLPEGLTLYSFGSSPMIHGLTTWTFRDGTFELAVPERAGAVALTALKPGYAAGRWEAERREDLWEQRPIITLERGIELRGRVTTSNGEPIAGVRVTIAEGGAYVGTHAGLLRAPDDGGWIRSDPDGRFATRLHPSTHDLALRRSGFVPKIVRGHDPRIGSALNVVLEPAAEIRGRVLRSDGSGVSGVRVYAAQSDEPTGFAIDTTGTDGGFVLGDLAPGSYRLQYAKPHTLLRGMLQVEAPVSGVRIELGPSGTLHGHVFDAENGKPVPRFSVQAEADSAGEREFRFMPPIEAEGGTFLLEEVPAGVVALRIKAEDYVARRIEGITVASGAQAPGIEVGLQRGARIRGQVTAEEGEALSGVSVSGEGEDGETLWAPSDELGEFDLRGVRPGRVKLHFARKGYRSARRTVEVFETEHVDVTLLAGLKITGQVLTEDLGVPKATVYASSSGVDAESAFASTDEQGRFTLAGLSPVRYTLRIEGPDGEETEVEDIDPASAGFLRVPLERREAAILSGWVTGLYQAEDIQSVMVNVRSEDGQHKTVKVDANGGFRMEKAPIGRVIVQASATSADGATWSSRSSELTLTAGLETETVLEFAGGYLITGEVWRDGLPLENASVQFRDALTNRIAASARTDPQGMYEMANVQPESYLVRVSGKDVSFEMEYVVTGDDRLVIDVSGAALSGMVLDAENGVPLSDVDLSLWRVGARENRPADSLKSDPNGRFQGRSLREGRYRILASKEGYGQKLLEIGLVRGETTEVLVELASSEGLTIEVVDARDDSPLDATVIVRDMARRIVANSSSRVGDNGALRIPLSPGQYLLSTSADGYGTATMPVTAPGSGLRVKLTPGGTLIVESERALRGRVRLVRPDGEEYVRCWCNGLAEIELTGTRTKIEHVTPAVYMIEVVDERGMVVSTGLRATIREGLTSRVMIE